MEADDIRDPEELDPDLLDEAVDDADDDGDGDGVLVLEDDKLKKEKDLLGEEDAVSLEDEIEEELADDDMDTYDDKNEY